MAKLTKNLAPLFNSSISYEPGERFMYGDHMYEALEPLSGAFDSTKVSEVTLADIFKGVSSNDVKCLAPEYDVNTEYSVENLVLHDGVLYECVETTTGPFDETKWSRKYLSDVGGLNSNLSSGVYCLGSGTSFNIKTLLPDIDYTKLTKENFIVAYTKTSTYLYVDGDGSTAEEGRNFSFSPSVSYNASTGVLSISGIGGTHEFSSYGAYTKAQISIGISVYLIQAEIKTV